MSRFSEFTGHPILGRGDLAEAFGSGNSEIIRAVAQQLGLYYEAPLEESVTTFVVRPRKRTPVVEVRSHGYPQGIEDITLWLLTGRSELEPLPEIPPGPEYLRWTSPEDPPEIRTLAQWDDVGARLRRDMTIKGRSSAIDFEKLTSLFAQRRVIVRLPRKFKRRWGSRVQIINDISLRLSPYEHEHQLVINELSRLIRRDTLEIAAGISPFELSRFFLQQKTDEEYKPYELPPPGSHVVVLSDLGCLDSSAGEWHAWLRWGRMMHDRGCRLQALVPCPESRIVGPLRQLYSIQTWQRPTTAVVDENRRAELLRKMFVLASPAVRVEPELLRELRSLIPEAQDASLEADFWNHHWLSSNHPTAATIDIRQANNVLRPEFEQLPSDLRKEVLKCIRRWRVHIQNSPEIWFEELLGLSPESQGLLPELRTDVDDARACIRRIDHLRNAEGSAKSSYEAYMHRLTQRINSNALNDAAVGRILRDAKRDLHPNEEGVADGTDPREIAGEHVRQFHVQVFDEEVAISSVIGGALPAAANIHSSNEHFLVGRRPTDSANNFWKDGAKPQFASEFGTDEYGPWLEFRIPIHNGRNFVTQRLRWIPSGRFLMGSSKDEPERFDDEDPQHEVTLSRGFWFADTACTQGLWQSVTGDNPSKFRGENRPVEFVSFEDVEKFLLQLNKLVPGLHARLPSEAQWEYACRAGTRTRFSFGEKINKDVVNFGGNRKGTLDVKSMPSNQWGLYEMHGNVWEWCGDWYENYSPESQVDPTGPEIDSDRVIRGGGWVSNARIVRSACRYWYDPGLRSDGLGFRLLSSCSAEPTEAAKMPVAEQGSQQSRIGRADEIFSGKTVRVESGETVQVPLTSFGPIRVRSNLEEIVLQRTPKPQWAVAFGHDRFGTYADFEVPPGGKGTPVRQRMRWIPPGRFRMGSPADEPGRWDEETQHDVTISSGFWMFDTPCTQALWQAVMLAENPSAFIYLQRPVERVNWEEASQFAAQLHSRIPELSFSLPTEAQWEYACRAGTTTAIYSGPLEMLGDANAPALDAIAWYGGNCGVDFDLSNGRAVTWLKNKQYDFEKGGTRQVKQKRPNPWGLYDMLGNVWEWCHDWHGHYSSEAQVDPMGPEMGLLRVVRGGGWSTNARRVRSACRGRRDPGHPNGNLGFRLLSSVGADGN